MTLYFNDGEVRIGCHLSRTKNLIDVLFYAASSQMNTMQLYISSPRSYKPSVIDKEDMRLCSSLMKFIPSMSVYVHACLLFNLNGSTHIDTFNLNLKKARTEKQKQKVIDEMNRSEYCEKASIEGLIETLNTTAKTFGKNSGVVVHIGSGEDKEKAIERIAKNVIISLTRGVDCEKRHVILENAAGEGNKIGSTLNDIEKIMGILKKSKVYNQVSICIDTCHLFAAGDYDISKESEMIRFFNDFEEKIGINKLKVIHLNDSQKEFGCKRDLHSTIGFGHIFSKNTNSLKYLLKIAKEHKIDLILETYEPLYFSGIIDTIYEMW